MSKESGSLFFVSNLRAIQATVLQILGHSRVVKYGQIIPRYSKYFELFIGQNQQNQQNQLYLISLVLTSKEPKWDWTRLDQNPETSRNHLRHHDTEHPKLRWAYSGLVGPDSWPPKPLLQIPPGYQAAWSKMSKSLNASKCLKLSQISINFPILLCSQIIILCSTMPYCSPTTPNVLMIFTIFTFSPSPGQAHWHQHHSWVPLHWLGTNHDISRPLKTSQELCESQTKKAHLVTSSHQGLTGGNMSNILFGDMFPILWSKHVYRVYQTQFRHVQTRWGEISKSSSKCSDFSLHCLPSCAPRSAVGQVDQVRWATPMERKHLPREIRM